MVMMINRIFFFKKASKSAVAMVFKSTVPVLLTLAFCVYGCGKKADLHKPIEQVKAEAQSMSASDLEKTAQAYAKEINAKKTELGKVTEELKKLSPKDLLSEKSKSIKDRASRIGSEIGELTGRYDVYARKFSEKGGDLSRIKLTA